MVSRGDRLRSCEAVAQLNAQMEALVRFLY
jgi:hypothetical protein